MKFAQIKQNIYVFTLQRNNFNCPAFGRGPSPQHKKQTHKYNQ